MNTRFYLLYFLLIVVLGCTKVSKELSITLDPKNNSQATGTVVFSQEGNFVTMKAQAKLKSDACCHQL